VTAPIHGPTILLSSGRYFSFTKPSALTVEEVAHALSNLCRFTGHCRQFYSVAQHAVLVSRFMPAEWAYEGLHHDDVEAVVGDMASPLKSLLPAYKLIEADCERTILAGFGIDWADPIAKAVVKQADLQALRTEQRDLMPSKGDVWSCLDGIKPWPVRIVPMPPGDAAAAFIERHHELEQRRREGAQALLGMGDGNG
jgi:hypothetical protein